ncbi:MAG TPA: hypothetical protein PKK99_12505 [Bacteroidia bacterium]|nr:hypothetical protein [Bacteroidia bacterium]
MNMVLINANEKFLSNKISSMNPERIYHEYLQIIKGQPLNVCNNSIHYLKAFVQYPPLRCLQIIRDNSNQQLTLSAWGDEYLHLITSIAAYYLDRNDKTRGVTWAIKALDLVDYFAPTIKSSVREQILYNMLASSMVCAYPKNFSQYASDNFFLKWELGLLNNCGYKTFSNDN